MKKWEKYLMIGASIVIMLTSGITLVNSFKDKADDTDKNTGTETACVQVVDM